MKFPLVRPSLLWILLSGLLAACSLPRPDPPGEPAVPASDRFHEAAVHPQELPSGSVPWWAGFQDPQLDTMVQRALTSNLDLERLAARISQADALLRQAGALLFPSLDGSSSFDSSWTRQDDSSGAPRKDASSLGTFLNWELDFWGRLRLAKSSRAQEVRAATQDWLAGRLFLSAAVAETYFEIREQHEQLRLVQEQIGINQTLLDLTQLRFGQSQSSIVDVLQQREQLAATRARVPDVEARLEQLEYALDVLLGTAPGNRERLANPSPSTLPALPAAGLPSELLANRPDLVAAQHRITALDSRVGEAVAARLPRFVFGGALTAAGDPGIHALAASTFASIAGPIFDAGQRKAEVDLRRAELREAMASYSAAYLNAVQEVETALLRDRKQTERVQLLEDQLLIAQSLLRESRNRYTQGLTDYLPVLNAVATEQNLQRELLTSRRESLSTRVALHRALGGPMGIAPVQAASRRR